MVINTKFGEFELIKNYRDAFSLEKFEERYVDVTFDKYSYIVGDISSDLLRIKGFSKQDNSENTYKKIPDYLNESCQVNCAHFILKRVTKKGK